MLLWIAVFVSDALINFLGIRFYDARDRLDLRAAVAFGAALDIVIGVNAMGFVEAHWWMLVPSVLGGGTGTFLSMRGRNKVKRTEKYEDQPYVKKLTALTAGIRPGATYDLQINHDDWCDLLNERGYCNCDPDVRIAERN